MATGNRNQLLKSRRWTITYTHACTCKPRCYWAKNGRHAHHTFLNNGEQMLGAQAAATEIARGFGHAGLADIKMRQETAEERDARLARMRREQADEKRGIHWAMGGAN